MVAAFFAKINTKMRKEVTAGECLILKLLFGHRLVLVISYSGIISKLIIVVPYVIVVFIFGFDVFSVDFGSISFG